MKKRRGAGNRGGRGRSGSGKRGDQKKPSYWADKPTKGFSSKTRTRSRAINLKDIELILLKKKTQEIDLKQIGFDKLLGAGSITCKVSIKAQAASPKAVEKVMKAGGQVILPKQNQAQP